MKGVKGVKGNVLGPGVCVEGAGFHTLVLKAMHMHKCILACMPPIQALPLMLVLSCRSTRRLTACSLARRGTGSCWKHNKPERRGAALSSRRLAAP